MIDSYDDPKYLEFIEEMDAINEGRATALTRCYLCHLDTFGVADMTNNASASPLRGIISEQTTPGLEDDPGADLYAALTLTCGHTII